MSSKQQKAKIKTINTKIAKTTIKKPKTYEEKMNACKQAVNITMIDINKIIDESLVELDIQDTIDMLKKQIQSQVENLVKKVTPKLKKPKPPNKPKAPLTSYMIFSGDERSKIKKSNPDMKFTEIAKEISKRWKALDTDSKSKYTSKNLELNKQYQLDLEAWRRDFPEEVDSENELKKMSVKAPKPKANKPPTAYNLYIKWMKEQDKKLEKPLTISQKREMWKELKVLANTPTTTLKDVPAKEKIKVKGMNKEIMKAKKKLDGFNEEAAQAKRKFELEQEKPEPDEVKEEDKEEVQSEYEQTYESDKNYSDNEDNNENDSVVSDLTE